MLKIILVFSIFYFLFSPSAVQAAGRGITVSPATKQVVLAEGQAEARVTLSVTNHSDQTVELTARAKDFGSLEDSGGLLFLGSDPDKHWDEHRLVEWLQLSPSQLAVAAGQTTQVEVKVVNDNRLTPGGHYGAVVITLSSSSDSAVAIDQSLTSLLFVNKQGGEVYGLAVDTVQPKQSWLGGVNEVSVRFDNTGNTHLVPRGQITVKNPFSQTIATGVINDASQLLLPEDGRTFPTDLQQSHLPWWPGSYTLVLSYRYDGSDQVLTKQSQVWSVGLVPVIGLALLVVAGASWKLRRYSD